jgi:uncharacterized protein YecE (DUF72 family)
MKRGSVWVGTSGWVYKHWAENFYPKGWPKKDEFAYYVRHFPTVEINATFYRLPTPKMVRGWHDRSPEGFVFAVKGSRFLTHIKRLKDTGAGLRKYFNRIKPLAERTGPILWQLPPNFIKNDETFDRLTRFLKKLPSAYRHAIEFRHPSWMNEETFTLLRAHHASNVWLSSLRMPQDYTVTTDFVYLRFHGLKDGAYHDYTDDELAPWAKQLAKAAERGIPSYVYFNNDLNTRAPLNAEALMAMLGKHAVPAFAAELARPLEIAPPEKKPETWRPWTRKRPRKVQRRRSNRRTASRARKARGRTLIPRTTHRRPSTARMG